MKTCPICDKEIVNGKNGCTMYDECFDCRPVRYYAPARKAETCGDYEELILAYQEMYMD